MMDQREKLIELLETIVLPRKELYSACEIADFMLNYGVVVLPCRCRECEYHDYDDGTGYCILQETVCDPDDFCSYGERKGGDE